MQFKDKIRVLARQKNSFKTFLTIFVHNYKKFWSYSQIKRNERVPFTYEKILRIV